MLRWRKCQNYTNNFRDSKKFIDKSKQKIDHVDDIFKEMEKSTLPTFDKEGLDSELEKGK